jgi:TonB-dependent starch-binding outer membrane protein SusC
MKKTSGIGVYFKQMYSLKIFKIMRITIFLLMLNIFQIFATTSYSQIATLSLDIQDVTIKEALSQIEEKSEFFFLYNSRLIDVNRKTNLTVKDQKIDQILSALFDNTDVNYLVFNRHIILSQKEYLKNVEAGLEQPLTLTGTVTDEKGDPLLGATVVVKGTTIGTVTDINGRFSIQVPEDAENLVFSYVGMASKESEIGDQRVFTIILITESLGLDELIVIGYGTQRKATLTGSVSTIDSEFIENRPITNASQALQGSLGLYVNQAGGAQPGADGATIRIRGVGTLGDNNPLVLVDGVPFDLRDVNPNDIESISVLKDAASASIYGNRAANGVILITTKKGKKGERMSVELHSYYGLQTATYLPDMVTNSADYMTARDQAAFNEGQPAVYGAAAIEEYRNGNDPDLYPNTDWWDIMFNPAPMQEHNLRISGGSDKTSYSFSVGYLDQEGVHVGTDAQRYSLNSNMTYTHSDRLEFGAILSGVYWKKNEGYFPQELMTGMGRALPIHPNILSDGRYGDTHLITPGHNLFRHPYALAKEGFNREETKRALINLSAQYILPLDIKYKANIAITDYNRYGHIFVPEVFIYNPRQPDVPRRLATSPAQRSVERANSNNYNTNFFQTLNWDKDINDQHNVNLLMGFSMESFYNSNFNAYIEGFLGNELTEIESGSTNPRVGGTSNESKLMSYFGRASYNFSDRYLLEFSFRYDGSSRFAKGNRWGFFPSISGAWNIHRESFMQNIPTIYNLKLRGSWGQLGNQNIALYSYASNLDLNQFVVRNGAVQAGSAVTTLADPNISWEVTTMSNIGLDLGLFENKLAFEFDIFDKYTTDILTRVNIPAQVGNLGGPVTNLYSMRNKGLEINTVYRGSVGELRYGIAGNIGFVDNKVDYLAGDVQYTTNRYGNIRVIQEGHPVNSWYLFIADGIFKTQEEIDNHPFQHAGTSPGDIKYRNLNDDDVIDINDMTIAGRSVPKATYGFSLDLGFKGFDLNAFFQGVYKVDTYPWHNVAFPLYNGAGITKEHFENSWTPENPDAEYPRLFLPNRGTGINARNSTFWLEDISYLRLKNLQLAYNIPKEITNRINISSLRVYINAQNLLTFSPYKVADPEMSVLDQRAGNHPSAKIFTLGANVNF